MKLFLIDWGEKCSGARYAIVQGKSKGSWDLWSRIDSIGDPSGVRAIEIGHDRSERLYIELPHMKQDGRMSGCYCEPIWAETYNEKAYPDYGDDEINDAESTITKHKTGWFGIEEQFLKNNLTLTQILLSYRYENNRTICHSCFTIHHGTGRTVWTY